MKTSTYISIFLFLNIWAHTEIHATNVDSLINVINNARHDSVRWTATLELVNYFQNTNPETGRKYGFKLLEIGQKIDEEHELEALLNLGNLYLRMGQVDSVEIIAKQALDKSQKSGNEVFQGRALITMGSVHEQRGELPEAIRCYGTALQKIKTTKDSVFLLNNLGLALVRSGENDKALEAYLVALKLAEQMKERRVEAVICGNLSKVYQDLGKFPLAIQWLERSIEIKKQTGDKPGLTYGYLNLGSLYYFEGIDKQKGIEFTQKAFDNASEVKDSRMMVYALSDLSTMHLEQKQYEAARIFTEKGMSLVGDDPAFNQPKSAFLKNLAVIENEANNFQKAYNLAREALALHPQDVLAGQPDIYFEMFMAQKGLGNFKDALELHEKYAALNDSLNKLEKTEKVAEVDAKYQAAEKDKAIAVLEKDRAVSLAEIGRRKAQVLYVALAALLLLSIAGWLFFRNRYKQALALEQMRTRIASDLHDEVGSSLSHLNFLIGSFDMENAPDLTAKGIEKSKEIMRKTASNIRDVVWAIDARRDKAGDLLDRMEDFAFDMFSTKNIACHFQADGMNRDAAINPFVRQNIFLVFKEAVNNIAKHSNATEVNISLSQTGTALELTVADNGTNTSPDKPSTGLGLENMQMRAKRIGGAVAIKNSGAGWTVRLRVG